MGFSEESFYKATYKKIYELLDARNRYMKQIGAGASDSDNEVKALNELDKFLG